MRDPASAIERYNPTNPPQDPNQLNTYLQQELARVSAALAALSEGQEQKCYVVPAKPRDGMRRYFDGTSANPTGGGEGLYLYYRSVWNKL